MNLAQLRRNLADVRRRIADACGRAGRPPADVTLVAVTKTVTADVARALVQLGVTDLGENRVQTAKEKRAGLDDLDVTWHMIGHLQTNKAKDAVRLFDLIHSVDSAHLAEAVSRRGELEARTVPVLVQVNVSGEDTKSGVPIDHAVDELRRIAAFPHLTVRGLMTMAPFVDDPETVRPVFVQLRKLAERITGLAIPNVTMQHLSTGMTQDFEVAIEEGATLVRIGTALFRDIQD